MSQLMRKMGVMVAMDLDGGIGKAGGIPWHLSKDFAYFVKVTSTTRDPSKINAVVMGRKCWDSIPTKFRPLRNRLNIVISRTLPAYEDEKLIVTNSFESVMARLSSPPLGDKIESIWNIGGSEIYAMALRADLVDTLVITRIESRFDADVKMSAIEWNRFEEDESERSEEMEEKRLRFRFHTYKRAHAEGDKEN